MASYGSLTVDGALGDWLATDRLDNSLNAIAGVEVYGRRSADTYVFALKAPELIAAGSTIWLNTDLDRSTGFQVFGYAVGAEYAIEVDATGGTTLNRYTSAGRDTTFSVALDHALSADGHTLEVAVAASAISGATGPVEAFIDTNDSAYRPTDYTGVGYTLRAGVTPVSIGGVALDGALSDWTAAQRIDTAVNGAAGYEVYGRVAGDSFVVALKSAVAIGPNTTFWLNTDQNTATGYQVFGAASGAEYAVEFDATGNPALYAVDPVSGALAKIGAVQASFSADHSVVEFAVQKAMIGTPVELDLLADVNNAVYLPNPYALPQYEIVDTAQLPVRTDFTKKIAIVYSETSAAKYFSATAYSQLFMNAQTQAENAGVNYDLINESDLKDISKLVNYDAIVFPSFSNVKASDVAAITNTLELATEQYHIGLIASGNFMTNDETGAALPGNSYARMEQLLGVTREAGGTGDVTLTAGDITHASMDGYAANEVIRSYTNVGWQDFRPVGAGVTTVKETVGGITYDAAIATETGGRNVSFSSEAVGADSNLLQHAIDWSVYGSGVRVGLQMSRFSSIVSSRTDLDQSSFPEDVSPSTGAGIYDKLLPILAQWKAAFNFVGSYYVNIGDPTITNGSTAQSTNWAKSLTYYKSLITTGNEVGSHSTTHLLGLTPAEDTNILTTGTGPGTFDYEFRLSRDMLNQYISTVVAGYKDTGAAVPGATETVATAQQILQYYDYISGGWSGIGGGYPGAMGYQTPGSSKVYIAPNVKFDFTLVQFQGMTIAQAEAEWAKEVSDIAAHSDVPIIVWPWHDYAATAFVTPGDPTASPYTTQMFTDFIAAAYAAGSEFVTEADLAKRIASFDHSGVTFTQTGNVINATVTSADAGKFALDLDGLGTQKIQSVAGWYAYDEDSVFTPRAGGAYAITLGATQNDVTHITSLPMRSELVTATGDGSSVGFSLVGEGKVVIDLKNPAGLVLNVVGATIDSLVGDKLTINVDNNLILNGSFEANTVASNNWAQFANGVVKGWTNGVGTVVELQNALGGALASDGANYAELDAATAVDTLQQNVGTIAGHDYVLSLDLRARPGIAAASNTVDIWFGGKQIATVDPGANWTTYTYTVSATAANSLLQLREIAADNDSNGGLIDNVRLTENLIVNGSFEQGALNATATVQNVANGGLTGWTNTGDTSVEVWHNYSGVTGTNGGYLVELDNGTKVDTLGQNVQTVAGALYSLSVDLRARVGNTDTVEIWWAGQKVATIDPTLNVWKTYTFSVLGTGGSDRLEFREEAADNNSLGALIDNVVLIGAGGQQHNVSVNLGAAPVNLAPTITSNGGGDAAAISMAENLTAVTTVTATNPEAGQTVSFSIAGGADAAKFGINPATGALSFLVAPDYENATDAGANHIYDVIVAATDNLGAKDTQAIAVTITNVNGVTLNGGAGSETLNGGGENDTISGGNGNDTINGNAGNDTLRGDAGIDNINGGAGDDTINGGTGQDFINGGDGNDRIQGDSDLDILTGGAGVDRFIYASTFDSGTNLLTRDIITDFVHAQDIVDVSAIDANTAVTGNQAFTFLATAGAAFTGAGQIRYYYTSLLGQTHTIIEGSTDADHTAEFSIDLIGRVALTASDFVL